MLRHFLFLILLALPLPGWASAPLIMIVGDSLSAGYGLPPGADWVTLLEERLREQGYRHRVINASISGDTTAGGAARLPAALARQQPDILLLELGGNDGLRGIAPAETERNLARMIELGQQADAKVLLAAVRLPPNYGPAFAERFEQVFTRLAERYRVPLIPFVVEEFFARPELVQPDGIHPTAEAQPLLLDQVWPKLEPVLEQTSHR
jgi:acyl-CoA thioesterase I